MKKLFLLFLLVPTLAFAGALTHVEIGAFRAPNGDRISAVYEVEGTQCTNVYLIFPDGRRVGIAVEKGTKPATIDRALQHIVDDNWNNVCTP
jgi:hypothetical protein